MSLILCLALALSLCSFGACDLASDAEAATLHRGDVSRASSEGIVLDADLYTKQPQFDKAISTASEPSKDTNDTVYTYSYALQVPAKTYQSLGTTVSVRWNDVGFDADDDRIDLVVSWLPDSRWYSMASLSRVPLLQRFDRNGFNTAGICIGINTELVGAKTCCEQHLKISFFKRGTSTPASGSFLTRFTDLDQAGWDGTYDDRWCESIEFISGHSSDMYVPSGNVLNIGKNRNNEAATDYRATKKMDGSSLDAGVVVRLSHGAEFWYYSTRGWTDFLDQFDAKAIALSSGAGGSVSCNGKTDTVAVGWRGNRTISITPSTGYKIADVKVDDSSVSARTAYAFTNVTANHTISASFTPISYTVRFNANGAGGRMDAMSVPYDTTRTLSANAFARAGYRFTGWNTKADGSGTAYQDAQPIRNLTSVDGAMIDLYAQWEPFTYSVGFDSNGGEGSMDDQRFTFDVAQRLSLNQFARNGYLFTGWNTNADGTGDAFENAQEVKNLLATNDGQLTLYAQWQPISYFVAFDGQGADGSMYDQVLTFDVAQALQENLFRLQGFRWVKWDTNPSVPEVAYEDRAIVKNLADRANEVVTLYAVWTANRCLIVFDKNGGAGEMEAQSVAYGTAEPLHANAFTREGWHWTSWNTASNGSGETFTDEQEVKNLAEDDNSTLILYAQWEPDTVDEPVVSEPSDPGEEPIETQDPLTPSDESPDPGEEPVEDSSGSTEPALDEVTEPASEPTLDTASESDAPDPIVTFPKVDSLGPGPEVSAFAKTGEGVLPLVCVASGLLVASLTFIVFGARRRRQEREAKRQLLRSRLGL